MSVYRFEDLRVWQAANEQAVRIGTLINRPEFRKDLKLADQMNDASISVPFNISEGFLRRRDKETMQFLRFAIASNGELKAGIYLAEGRTYISSQEAADLIALNEGIAKMLRRWQSTLNVDSPETRGRRTKDRGRTKDPGPRTDEGPRTRD